MTEPFAEQLDEILDELAGLDDDDALVLADAWQQQDAAVRRRAWATASQHIERAGLSKLLDRARTEVGRWAAAGGSDFDGLGGALLGRPNTPSRLRMAAAPALLDAVAAMLARDALDADELAVLTAPWQALEEDDGRADDGPPDRATG